MIRLLSVENPASPLVLNTAHPHGVVEFALNRPDALNALSVTFVRAIHAAVAAARALDRRVVVVTSRCERAFSVGADLKERARMSADELIACRPEFRSAYRSLLDLPFPQFAQSAASRSEEGSSWR